MVMIAITTTCLFNYLFIEYISGENISSKILDLQSFGQIRTHTILVEISVGCHKPSNSLISIHQNFLLVWATVIPEFVLKTKGNVEFVIFQLMAL